MSDLELARARAKAKAKAMRLREERKPEKRDFTPSLEDMEKARQEVDPTTGEALAAGWVEGVPFLKDAVSAYDGIAETIEEGGSFEDGYSRYEEKLKDMNKDLNAVEEQAPWTMAAGEIGGTAATMVAGGAALKGAGAGAVLTERGIQAASAIGTGALQGLSRSEDRGPEDVAVGAALGVAGEVGGHYIGKAAKKGGKYLMDKADDIYAMASKKIMGIETATASRQLRKYLKQNNMKESEFLSSVLTRKMKDSDELVISMGKETPERMLDKTEVYLEQTGQELGKLYRQVDDKFDVKVDVEDLKNSLIDDVVEPMLKSDDPDMQDIGMNLSKYIQRIGTKVKSAKKEVTPEGTKLIEDLTIDPDWNLQRMHRLQVNIRKRLESLFKQKNIAIDSSKEQHRKVATSLGKHIDEVLEAVSTESDPVLNNVMKTRKDFSSMSLIRESMEDAIHRKKDDPIALLKEAISFKSLLAGGVAAKYVGPAGLVVGPVFSRMMNDPNTPVYLSKGLGTIGKTIQAVPGGRIATRLNTAALMTNDKFEEELYSIVAENNLSSSPIPRDTQKMRDHVQDIRHFLRGFDKKLLKQFDTVLETENEDAIAALMDGLSKAPNAQKFFESGVGFNGKVYSDEDKQALERQLRMTDMPAAQRMEMMENLRSGGIIPDFNNIVQPQPIQHQPRTKKLKDY